MIIFNVFDWQHLSRESILAVIGEQIDTTIGERRTGCFTVELGDQTPRVDSISLLPEPRNTYLCSGLTPTPSSSNQK